MGALIVKMKRNLLFLLLLGIIGLSLSYFCNHQTQGFRFYTLLSNLPNDPRWEVDSLPSEQMTQIQHLLDQPFTFLGKGGWCTAFLGADGTTVLKFYKHDHLSLKQLFRNFSFGKLLLKGERLSQSIPYFQEFNFKSCTLLYTQVPHLTGLIYVHLNKTDRVFNTVTLYDQIGIKHALDLNQTEFVVQKRADLLFERLQALHDKDDLGGGKKALDQLFSCLVNLSQSCIRDLDKKLYENYGYVGNQAIALDLSSFVCDPEIKDPAVYRKEIIAKTLRLRRWLNKHYPELVIYFDEKIEQLN